MWLLKLHIAFSVLCLFIFWGGIFLLKIFLKNNGCKIVYRPLSMKMKDIMLTSLTMFIPILNIFDVFAVLGTFAYLKTEPEDFMSIVQKSQQKLEENSNDAI